MSIKLKNYIFNHLKNLKIKKGDNLLVYSDLSKFGFSSKSLPRIIISNLKLIVGKSGTIVMPFYNFEKGKNFAFNKKKFFYTNMVGSLTKEFCKEKKILRSKSLIHNHIGLGPKANVLDFSKEDVSIGKDSDFEFFKNYNFKLLMLACEPIQGATYLHHLEAIYKVPYRKWIILKRKKILKGVKKNVFIKYFAKKNNNYVSDFNSVFKKIRKYKSIIYEQKVKYGRSYFISLKHLDKIGLKFLKENKYSFVKKK